MATIDVSVKNDANGRPDRLMGCQVTVRSGRECQIEIDGYNGYTRLNGHELGQLIEMLQVALEAMKQDC